ncbi:MAG: homocysteine S-methyltransferase family protein [Faecousia sp.]
MKKEEFAALCKKKIVLLDGATGSNLMKAGMPRGVCTEAWVCEHPQALLELQRAYVRAGSDIIYAPTFSANRHSLARHGLEARVRELNTKLVALSKEAAEGNALVAGDLTTTGVPLEPMGTMRYQTLFDLYREQIEALCEAGADLLVVETMLAVDETTVALEAAQAVCDLPVLCSLTVQADGSAYFGGDCVEAVQTLQELDAAAVGINCSCGPEQLVSLVRNMQRVARVPLLVKPNAGLPAISDSGEAVYPMGAAEFARHMAVLTEAGARLIGGCCGTTPEFIAELNQIRK